MESAFVGCFISSVLFHGCLSFPNYQNLIPNGNAVPDTCDVTDVWSGVGHIGPLGSGPRNAFGNDFAKAGRVWTRELCQTDSDGDGMTNGEELGDPLCQWSTKHKTPLRKTLSNPGVCDPWNSTLCSSKNGSVDCSTHEEPCTAIFDKDTKRLNLMLPLTRVPPVKNVFACMRYNLPADRDFHIIASKPIYNNRKTVHFIAVFGCKPTTRVEATDRPFYCSAMPEEGCNDLIAGYVPMCFDEHAGIKIGPTGYKQVLVQWYLRNPDLKQNLYDNSGIALYYTEHLRRYNMGVGTLVATGFTIPPNEVSYNVSNTCPEECTGSSMSADIHVAMTIDHMHLFGSRQKIEHIRKGVVRSILSHDDHFNPYDPGVFWNKDPITVKPRDSFRMICEYNSTLTTQKIEWGLDFSHEMCLGRIFYYPKEAWRNPLCASYKSIPLCMLNSDGSFNGCNVRHFLLMLRTSKIFTSLEEDCVGICNEACLDHIARLRRHPCLQGHFYELWQYAKYQRDPHLNKIYKTFLQCEKEYKNHGSFLHNAHAHK